MNQPMRTRSLQAYQLLLYRRPLHPEHFPLKARRLTQHGAYELESWVMPGGHLLRFRNGAFSCCELVIDQDSNLPLDGAVTAFPIAGEHDFEHAFPNEKVGYVTSAQTETLSESLYSSTYDEMIDFAKETGAVVHKWTEPDGSPNLSMLDIQRLNREVHAQSYHLLASGGIVIRTQTIFEQR